MYRTYEKAAGFGIRLGSTTTYGDYSLRKKHVRCNRYGQPRKKSSDTLTSKRLKKQERKSYSKVTGCMAMIGFDRDYKTNTITIYAFEEAHNHPLIEFNEESLCSHNHRLSISDQELIFKASTLNIGATKAHKIRASLKGGYDHLPAAKNDFKNFWRDYTNIVGPNDAQCVVDQLIIRRDNYPNFHFEYKLNDEELSAMFWVDETGKENYSKFLDVISMDATYRTNRYNMIFVPFTAINNHEKTINVGAGLISDETIESYSWLLKAFLSAHKKKTNHDFDRYGSSFNFFYIKGASRMYTQIMYVAHNVKNAFKVSNSDFKKRINQLIWRMNIEPSEFECQWDMMLDEFDLRENKWLDDMFNKRDKWIPSYFRDIPMCGLMKTTSRSESSNSFFNVFSSATNLLVNFIFNLDTALSKQRHEQKRLDIASRDTSPQLLFAPDPLKIEKHASLVYTREAFLKVQKQIKKAFYQCFQKTSIIVNGFQECTIVYKEVKSGKRPEFQVSFNAHEQTIDCACLHFQFFGILCSHAFRVLIDYDI
ncbi:protein FAR1-RELATED SEQUENCE 5-like [Lactuca sativa]|nr:protein FAR1-RELATED SEQUENCE 5-like [Lactuca sativa]